MKGIKNRKATFVCSLSYKNNNKIITVEGKLKGKISTKILGNKGFGYDPIFFAFKRKDYIWPDVKIQKNEIGP